MTVVTLRQIENEFRELMYSVGVTEMSISHQYNKTEYEIERDWSVKILVRNEYSRMEGRIFGDYAIKEELGTRTECVTGEIIQHLSNVINAAKKNREMLAMASEMLYNAARKYYKIADDVTTKYFDTIAVLEDVTIKRDNCEVNADYDEDSHTVNLSVECEEKEKTRVELWYSDEKNALASAAFSTTLTNGRISIEYQLWRNRLIITIVARDPENAMKEARAMLNKIEEMITRALEIAENINIEEGEE